MECQAGGTAPIEPVSGRAAVAAAVQYRKLSGTWRLPAFATNGDRRLFHKLTKVGALVDALPELPPHVVSLDPARRPPALVYSDGACEGDGRLQDIGFVIAMPLPHARVLPRGETPSLARIASDYRVRGMIA